MTQKRAELQITAVPRRPDQPAIRRYIAVGDGPAAPVGLLARIAAAGIRLRCSGDELVAEVPQATTADRSRPTLDRRLARHACSLAMTVSLARRFGAPHPPERLAAMLAELRSEVPEILLETVAGAEHLIDLIAGPAAGAEFDLACVVCCRGLARRAIYHGLNLAGVLAYEERDDEERGRRQTAAAASWRNGVREGAAQESAECEG